jgi:hypothetical protein
MLRSYNKKTGVDAPGFCCFPSPLGVRSIDRLLPQPFLSKDCQQQVILPEGGVRSS